MNNLLMYAGTCEKLGLATTMDESIKKVQIVYRIKSDAPTFLFGMMPVISKLVENISEDDVADSYLPYSRNQPFSGEDWGRIADDMGGNVPVNIYMADEGKLLNDGDVALVIETTDERFAWMAEHVASVLEAHMKRMLELSKDAMKMSTAIRNLVVRDSDREGTDLTKLFLLAPEKGMSLEDMQIKATMYKLVCPLEASPISARYIVDNYLPSSMPPAASMSAHYDSNTNLAELLRKTDAKHLNLFVRDADNADLVAALTPLKQELNDRYAPLVICLTDGDVSARAIAWMKEFEKLVGLEQNSLGLEYSEKQFGVALKVEDDAELTAFGDKMKKAGYTVDGYSFLMALDAMSGGSVTVEKASSFFVDDWDDAHLKDLPSLAYQEGATTVTYSIMDVLKRLVLQMDEEIPHDAKPQDDIFPGRYSGWWVKNFVLAKDKPLDL